MSELLYLDITATMTSEESQQFNTDFVVYSHRLLLTGGVKSLTFSRLRFVKKKKYY